MNKFINSSALLAILIASAIIFSHANIITSKLSADSEWYIELAAGNYHNVGKPFINRVVYPLTARLIVLFSGVDIKHAFLALNVLFLFILLLSLFSLIKPFISIKAFYIPIIFTPVLLDLYKNYCLPELFYAALLGVFFLLLRQEKLWASLVLLFFLFLTRENTIILSCCAIIICFYNRQIQYAVSVIVVSVAAMIAISFISHYGQPNIHRLPELLYLTLKIPINFVSNFTGIIIWTNTLPVTEISSHPWHNNPLFQVALPNWLRFGEVTAIGIYGFDIFRPLNTFLGLFTSFGIGPVLLFLVMKRHYRSIAVESPVWLLIAMSYGIFSFLLGTSIGSDVTRLIAYGWPAFWIVTPILILKYYYLPFRTIIKLLIINLLLCWLNTILLCFTYNWYITTTITICLAIILYGFILWRFDCLDPPQPAS